MKVPDWPDRIIGEGSTALLGADRRGEIRRIDIQSGTTTMRGTIAQGSAIVGFTDKTLLVLVPLGRAGGELNAIDRDTLAPLWKHTALSPQNASVGERYLVQANVETILRCLDAATGEVLWQVDFSESRFSGTSREPLRIVQGYPSVVVVGQRVLVVMNDTRIVVLATDSGEVLDVVCPGIAAPPRQKSPMHLITKTSIFYLHAFGMVEFDHQSMKAVSEVEFRADVEPHYAKAGGSPYPCAFWVSSESVIWTNMSGLLIGVSRKLGRNGVRTVWADWMPGALVPVAQFPLAFKQYIYFAEYGEKRVGLRCYKGNDRGAGVP
jgi:hypothetical protein